MEEEAETRAQGLLAQIAGEMMDDAGIRPAIMVRQGEPAAVVAEVLAGEHDVHALVLGAAAKGGPGPLVSYFAGEPAEIRNQRAGRSEEHTSELQSLMRISYSVFFLQKKNKN